MGLVKLMPGSIFTIVYVHGIHTHICMSHVHWHICVCVCIQWPQVDAECLLQLPLTVFIDTGPRIEARARQFYLTTYPEIPCLSTFQVLILQVAAIPAQLMRGCWDEHQRIPCPTGNIYCKM